MRHTATALLIVCALLAACARGAAAQQQQHITLTIEAADGAVLVRGPQAAVNEARAAVDAAAAPAWTAEQARAFILSNFAGRGLDALVFAEASAQGGKGVSRVETSLRRALLLGLLPPVEGLPEDAAAAVLDAAGLRHITRSDWDALSGGGQYAAIARDRRPLAVLAGTDPHDAAIIIYLDPDAKRGETD